MDRYHMVLPGDSIVVGVSGGPDSIALLHSLHEISADLSLKIIVAHLNHCTRGRDSDEDAEFVEKEASSLGLDCFLIEKDVREIQRQRKGSFHEVARQVRREFFKDVCTQTGAQKVALGHTRDDQAETILMNMLRGSGSRGMSGMSPVREKIIRPLLDSSRRDVLGFLDRKRISFRTDSSNQSPDYLRNRIRMNLIPLLEKGFNPNLKNNLASMSELLQDEDLYMDQVTEDGIRRLNPWDNGQQVISLEINELHGFPLAIQRRLVRKCISLLKGDLRRVSHLHIQEILNLTGPGRDGKKTPLPDGLEVSCKAGRLIINKIPDSPESISNIDGLAREVTLVIPGEAQLPSGNYVFTAELKPRKFFREEKTDPTEAFLDFDVTGDRLLFRNYQLGDRFQPLGMSGSKKLKEFFIDQKIPRHKRDSIPILTTGEGDIVWVYGCRIAHPFRVTEDTRNLLYIKGLKG